MAADVEASALVSSVGFVALGERLRRLTGLEDEVPLDDLEVGFEGGRLGAEERLRVICDRFGLEPLERAVLAAVLLPEVSPELGALLAQLGGIDDGITPRGVARTIAGPGVSVGDVLAALDADAPLRASGAVLAVGAPTPGGIADRPLRAAPRLASVVLGTALDDPTLGGRLRRLGGAPLPVGRPELVAELAALLEVRGRPTVVLEGDDALPVLLAAADADVIALQAPDALDRDLRAAATFAARIEGAVVVVDRLELLGEGDHDRLAYALDDVPELVVLATGPGETALLDRLPSIALPVRPPTAAERAAAWDAALGPAAAEAVADRYRLPIGRITQAAWAAATAAAAAGRDSPTAEDCERGARLASASRIGQLARRVTTDLGWDDLILPERQVGQLRALSAFLRHRELVLDTWGFGRRSGRAQGLVAMFCGESGTGKTLAARVLAADLRLELFRIDLASVVSKWLGETERNLDRVFAAAHGANAVLFFDEADAVFGKRSDVESSHDRYANLETAYLLQRIESHDGPVVLATNLRNNVDEAFIRRMDAVVELPFPQAGDRRRLWDLLLPPQAPRAGDVDLDFLAERFELSGGGIRNAALTGAVLAAEAGAAIGMEHLVRGVAHEYTKLGRLTLAADFERFHDLVRVNGGTA